MSFRSAIKRGGSFLNGDCEFVGYEFTRRFKGETEDGDNVYCVPQFHMDGAENPTDQHLLVGRGDRYEISDDGQELSMVDGSPVTIPFSLPFGYLVDSMITAAEKQGMDLESELPDLAEGEPLSLTAVVGRRFRLKQEVDEAANNNPKVGPRRVKVKDPKTGKMVNKEYPRTRTTIDAVLGASNGKASGGGAVKGKSGDAIASRAKEVLESVLAEGPESRKNLALPVTKALLKDKTKDKTFADAVKAKALDQEWQEEQDWLEIDKKGNLALAA